MEVMRTASRIAIVGASPHPLASLQLGHALPAASGLRVRAGHAQWPRRSWSSAATPRSRRPWPRTGAPFDIVDVFRRPEYAPDIARSAVATGCGALWLQQGVISWEAAGIAHDGGLAVVMDRCSAVEHRHLRSLSD